MTQSWAARVALRPGSAALSEPGTQQQPVDRVLTAKADTADKRTVREGNGESMLACPATA
jgi:hypothetical protein